MPAQPKRKRIRLPASNYVGDRWYFITICTHGRRRVFANPKAAAWVARALRTGSNAKGFRIYAYCVMPDHLHFLAQGTGPNSNLLDLVADFKQRTGLEWLRRNRFRLWQFKYYDHILRKPENVDSVAGYIWMNPVRKGICKDPFDYPFSGSFMVEWKRKVPPVEPWHPPWKPPV